MTDSIEVEIFDNPEFELEELALGRALVSPTNVC